MTDPITGTTVRKSVYDAHMVWCRRRVFRNAQQLASLVTNATGPVSADAGASILSEISTSGLAGLKCTATTDLAQDFMPIPADLEKNQASYWRVWWCTDTTNTTLTFLPVVKYSALTDGGAIAAGATALNTAIVKDTSNGANKLNISGWGTCNADLLDPGKILSVGIQADGSVTTKTVWIIGYEFEYTPRMTNTENQRHVGEAARRISY